MTHSPTLGAVIPTIGRNSLDETLQSALQQKISFDEIIVFDNSVAQDAQSKSRYAADSNVRWVKSGNCQLDIINSWNTAAASATAEHIVMLGDDDLLDEQYVEVVRQYLDRSDGLIIVPTLRIDAASRVIDPLELSPLVEKYTPELFREALFLQKFLNYMTTPVFKMQTFHKIGGYKRLLMRGLGVDWFLLLELSLECRHIMFIRQPLWYYRSEATDWCGRFSSDQERWSFWQKIPEFIAQIDALMARRGIPEDKRFFPDRQTFTERVEHDHIKVFMESADKFFFVLKMLNLAKKYNWHDKLYVIRKRILQNAHAIISKPRHK